jgi:hypothetical protein
MGCVSRYGPSRLHSTWNYRQLFGEDEDAVGELDEAEKQGENGTPLLLSVDGRLTPAQLKKSLPFGAKHKHSKLSARLYGLPPPPVPPSLSSKRS